MRAIARVIARWLPPRVRTELAATARSFGAQRALGRRINGGPILRRWIAILPGVLMIKQHIPWFDPWALPVKARGEWFWVGDWSELLVLAEVFGQPPEYAFDGLPIAASTVLDLGSNVGIAARWFVKLYPSAQIICCEPDPLVVRRARRNLKGCQNVTVRTVALGASAGTARLQRYPGESWRSTTQPILGETTLSEAAIDVDVTTLDELIDGCGGHVTILKMDIEGAEYGVIEASARLGQVDYIIGEIHLYSVDSEARFFDLLPDFDVLERRNAGEQIVFLARRRDAISR